MLHPVSSKPPQSEPDYLKYVLLTFIITVALALVVGLAIDPSTTLQSILHSSPGSQWLVPASTLAITPAPAQGTAIYPGNLHMHTTCSDGQNTYDDLVEAAVKLGFKFIAITDHHICPEYFERCKAETRILCIPSMEFTTPNGHVLAIDISDDPAEAECSNQNKPARTNPDPAAGIDADTDTDTAGEGLSPPCDGGLSLQETVSRIHAQGGLAIAAHPVATLPNNWLNKINPADLPLFDAMECDAPVYGASQRAESDALVQQLGIPCVFDSDAHDANSLGSMYDLCELDNLSINAIKEAITHNKCRPASSGFIRV